MKKIISFVFLLAGLFGYCVALAETSVSEIPTSLKDDDSFVVSSPLSFSYESGQWISSNPGKIFTTGKETTDFTLPFLKEKPQPIRYPRWALDHDSEGTLVVAIEIRVDGTAGRWKIMQSSGHKLLDRAAVNAIRTWRFEPARERGKPIVSCIQIPIRFIIDKS